MITDYKILEKGDRFDLEFEVKEAIKDNWQPFGSLVSYQIKGYRHTIATDQKTEIMITMYLQAMVKYSN